MFSQFQRLLLAVLVVMLFLYAGRVTANWIENAKKAKPDDVLTVGLIDDTPPFCFYNDQNKLVGVNIDTVKEIGRRVGKKVHIESVSFNRLTSGLMTRQYDIVSIGSITPDRAKVVRYVQPHLVSADVMLVHPQHKTLQSLMDFKGHPWRIGVYNGTSYIKLLKEKGLEQNMVIYPNQRDVFLAFYKHRVDAIIMNEDVATYIQSHLDPSIVILPEKIRTDRKYAFSVHKDNLKLWRELNKTVIDMVADGTFERYRQKWVFAKPAAKRNS